MMLKEVICGNKGAFATWDVHTRTLYNVRRRKNGNSCGHVRMLPMKKRDDANMASVTTCHAEQNDGDLNSNGQFDVSMYYEAYVQEVRTADGQGNVIFLKLNDQHDSVLPVYIGEFECGALMKEINKRSLPRPGTHDLMKNIIDSVGYVVTKVRITSLVGNIYHARIHLSPAHDTDPRSSTEMHIDCRPSDAINMAARYDAPIYVNKEVAARMAHPARQEIPGHESQSNVKFGQAETKEIVETCKQEILQYNDPTIMYKLQLQVAIAEERFEDASKLRDIIEKALASDRALSLVVAMETALEDHRFEEAARLRDELHRLQGEKAEERNNGSVDRA
jgi:bifunctional DNase/RNase